MAEQAALLTRSNLTSDLRTFMHEYGVDAVIVLPLGRHPKAVAARCDRRDWNTHLTLGEWNFGSTCRVVFWRVRLILMGNEQHLDPYSSRWLAVAR